MTPVGTSGGAAQEISAHPSHIRALPGQGGRAPCAHLVDRV